MNVSLTPRLEGFVRRQVASGLYNNASEVIREALRLLVARESNGTGVATGAPASKEHVRACIHGLEKTLRVQGITSLALFGSIIHDEFSADSDIDVLIDIDPEARFSLVDLVAVKDLLEECLGREVDVVTREGIEPAIRDRVLREAEAVF